MTKGFFSASLCLDVSATKKSVVRCLLSVDFSLSLHPKIIPNL